jgi:hypothetical protein
MAVFQLLIVLGAPLGQLAWGGFHPGKLPKKLRWASLVSVAVFILATICVLEKSGQINLIGIPDFVQIMIWIFTVIFGLSTIANFYSKSKLEKRVMTPIALALFILCFLIAIG